VSGARCHEFGFWGPGPGQKESQLETGGTVRQGSSQRVSGKASQGLPGTKVGGGDPRGVVFVTGTFLWGLIPATNPGGVMTGAFGAVCLAARATRVVGVPGETPSGGPGPCHTFSGVLARPCLSRGGGTGDPPRGAMPAISFSGKKWAQGRGKTGPAGPTTAKPLRHECGGPNQARGRPFLSGGLTSPVAGKTVPGAPRVGLAPAGGGPGWGGSKGGTVGNLGSGVGVGRGEQRTKKNSPVRGDRRNGGWGEHHSRSGGPITQGHTRFWPRGVGPHVVGASNQHGGGGTFSTASSYRLPGGILWGHGEGDVVGGEFYRMGGVSKTPAGPMGRKGESHSVAGAGHLGKKKRC